jgi:type IV pilus assembly protein PilM
MASYGSEHGIQEALSSNFSPETLSSLEQEIRRMVLALKKELRIKEQSPLCFVGEGATLKPLTSHLSTTLNQPMLSISPPTHITTPVGQLLKFAAPIGLSLNCLTTSSDPINFRQDEFVYGSPWKRFMQPLIIYGACCLLLAGAFYTFGEAYLSYRLDQAREHYVDLLTTLRKPYTTFEKDYDSKILHEDEVVSINKLNRTDLLDRLGFLQKQLQSMPDTYALYPNIPLVSDFLAWLSNHPKIKCPAETSTDPCEGSLQLDSLTYTMAKRPDQSKKGERYQIKVDLEFTSPTPTLAREFHDALIAPNEIVDPKGEVKWSGTRGKYRASFFLKEKTVLPSLAKKEEAPHV